MYRRLAQTQVWPLLRYLEMIAPSTALSRSASSNTMNGALPPNSRDTFLMSLAHSAINWRPISVEPVKDNLRTIGLLVSSLPISPALPETTLNTPFLIPGNFRNVVATLAISFADVPFFAYLIQ